MEADGQSPEIPYDPQTKVALFPSAIRHPRPIRPYIGFHIPGPAERTSGYPTHQPRLRLINHRLPHTQHTTPNPPPL